MNSLRCMGDRVTARGSRPAPADPPGDRVTTADPVPDSDDDDGLRVRDAAPDVAATVPSAVVNRDGKVRPGRRMVAAETPVSITYNGIAHAVMMATPADVEDFVTGFSLTEEIVAAPGEIEALTVRALDTPRSAGLVVDARIPAARLSLLLSRRRSTVGQTGCGLCGITELTEAVRSFRPVAAPPPFDAAAVFAAFDALPGRQELNRATGAAHAAAFADAAGRLVAVREDVGRHNALDKLIGHLARVGIDPAGGFVAMTSRLSFELVQKCLASRIPALAGVSAPTALAIEIAARHRLTLVGLARSDGFQAFTDPFGRFGGLAGTTQRSGATTDHRD